MSAGLTCEGLSVRYPPGAVPLRGVSFAVAPGECLALLGASGAGKSTLARALLGLHGPGTRVSGGLRLDGADLPAQGEPAWRRLRGRRIGYVGQNPFAACDPLRPVRDHVAEAWRCHGLDPAPGEVADRLAALGIPDAARRAARAPHAWSGGMLQRASIAAALAHAPPLVVADEPTSALDAERAHSVLAALRSRGSAVVLISHDVGLVLRHADRVGVLAEGRLVETAAPEALRRAPAHPETRRLIAATAPLPARPAPGARLLRARGLAAEHGVAHADLDVAAGEVVGVQGPSGCGKSTLLRLLMGIEAPSAGRIDRAPSLERPGAVMPVFQDPVSSLPARWPLRRAVTEPLTIPGRPWLSRRDRRAEAERALASVGLAAIDPEARPAELSVGQCQRACLARALIARPALILADEPTSALDAPSTHAVAGLLSAAAEGGAGVVVVSHDPALLARLADRVVRMTEGRTLPAAARAA